MLGKGRYDAHHPRLIYGAYTVYGKFKPALQHLGRLFMEVIVPGHHGAGFHLPKGDGEFFGMNKAGPVTFYDLPGFNGRNFMDHSIDFCGRINIQYPIINS